MTLFIKGYEVEIKAKKNKERFNKKETMLLLSEIACFAYEANLFRQSKGLNAIANTAEKVSREIHAHLKLNGF